MSVKGIGAYFYIKEGVVCISFIFLIVVVSVAAVMDLLFDKIYNEWILLSIAAGLSFAVWQGGGSGLLRSLLAMAIPIVVLYPFFMIGGLGAGDVKLLAAVGCFLTIKGIIITIGLSFLTGAVISLLKMLAERNFLQRMKYLWSYILDVFKSREWKFYEEDIQENKKKKEGKIHFALPILLGVILGGLA